MSESPSSPSEWRARAQHIMDEKAKPPGSLGLLEEWAVQLCVLQRSLRPRLDAARLVVFAADHGITADAEAPWVSAYPRALTATVFAAAASGGSACATLAAASGVAVEVVDVGIDADVRSVPVAPGVAVVHAKLRHGSHSLLRGPALTPDEVSAALEAGAAAVARAAGATEAAGLHPSACVVCVGEIGIGNTTAAAALLAALTGAKPEEVCGRGTGLDDAGLQRKCAAVAAALAANAGALAGRDPLAALAAVGGLELAAMAGAFLEAGRRRMPALVDGFVSGAAALAALCAAPATADALFWSHSSAERGAARLLQAAHARPALSMGMRLGEGTGALLAVPLLRSAAALMRDMASLEQALAATGAAPGRRADEPAANGEGGAGGSSSTASRVEIV